MIRQTMIYRCEEPLIQTVDQGHLALAARLVKQAVDDCQHGVNKGLMCRALKQQCEVDLKSGRSQVVPRDIDSLEAAEWLTGTEANEWCELISSTSGVRIHRDYFLRRLARP